MRGRLKRGRPSQTFSQAHTCARSRPCAPVAASQIVSQEHARPARKPWYTSADLCPLNSSHACATFPPAAPPRWLDDRKRTIQNSSHSTDPVSHGQLEISNEARALARSGRKPKGAQERGVPQVDAGSSQIKSAKSERE